MADAASPAHAVRMWEIVIAIGMAVGIAGLVAAPLLELVESRQDAARSRQRS